MLPFLIGAGIASGIAGIGNYLSQSSANDRAAMLQDKAFQQWMALNVPNPEDQKVVLDKFINEGTLDPKMETAIKADPSAFENIVTNSGYKAAQDRALSQLQDIGNEGGLRLQDKATIQDARMEGIVKDRAQRDSINAEMERRGAGGSGFQVAAQLAGQQSAGDRDAMTSLRTASDANERALKAIEAGGTMAGQLRGQDFSEQSEKAKAADRINQFNTENLRDVNQRNNALFNRSQEMNLANKQRISDKNVETGNQESVYNKGLLQQQFENQAQRLAGATGQLNKEGETAQKSGQLAGNAISNIGGAASGAASTAASMDFWDNYFKNKK